MLAYVFWHTAILEAQAEEYERWLRAFHEALHAGSPPGYLGSTSFRIDRAPWLPSTQPVYEDWYLVEGSEALDPLNDAAVSGRRQVAHDRTAALAGNGIAGLYRLRKGRSDLEATRAALWLSKPRGQPYADFYTTLDPRFEGGATTLWGRQMVLGPTPEFCLHAEHGADLPADLGILITLEPVWTGLLG